MKIFADFCVFSLEKKKRICYNEVYCFITLKCIVMIIDDRWRDRS